MCFPWCLFQPFSDWLKILQQPIFQLSRCNLICNHGKQNPGSYVKSEPYFRGGHIPCEKWTEKGGFPTGFTNLLLSTNLVTGEDQSQLLSIIDILWKFYMFCFTPAEKLLVYEDFFVLLKANGTRTVH